MSSHSFATGQSMRSIPLAPMQPQHEAARLKSVGRRPVSLSPFTSAVADRPRFTPGGSVEPEACAALRQLFNMCGQIAFVGAVSVRCRDLISRSSPARRPRAACAARASAGTRPLAAVVAAAAAAAAVALPGAARAHPPQQHFAPVPVAAPPAPTHTTRHAPRHVALRVLPRRVDGRVVFALKCALLAGIATSVVVSATIAVFWIIQDSLVYKPTSVWRGSPKTHDMPYFEDVNYCTMDNVEITGWFIKQPPEVYRSARTLIYFHGTDKNASFRLKKVVGFYKHCGCNVLLLSYRGYGASTGKPNEKGVRIDAESAFHYLKSRGDVDVSSTGNLWVFGESLGGAVAIHFTSVFEKHINALILENTFTSLLDMIKLEFPILGVFRYLSRNRWQSKKRIKNLSLPILFLSGQKDAYIPPRMMRQMHDLAQKSRDREFVEFERGTHNGTWTLDGFYEAVAAFMARVDARSSARRTMVADSRRQSGDGNDVVAAAA